MDYNVLKVFYYVASMGSISKAAKSLFTSQPAISRTIANFESNLETKLFIRGKSGVVLTREGLSLYERIKGPFEELERLEQNYLKSKSIDKYTIHIGATVTSLHCYLFNYLDNLKKKYKNVNFNIYTGGSNSLLEMLKSGKIDIAFITTPFNKTDDLLVNDVYKINNILIAPYKLHEQFLNPISIKNLTKYPFILLSKEMQFREHIDTFFFKNDVNIVPEYEADSSSVLVPLVKREYGLSFVPEEMAYNSLKNKSVIKVNLIEQIPYRYVSIALNKKRYYNNIIYEIRNYILDNSKL